MVDANAAAHPPAPFAGGTALAGLIASRICHDLISPVGAIGNGVELIELVGAAGPQELSLIGDSARSASSLLQFFRLAFGAGLDAGPHGVGALRRILDQRFGRERAALVWRVAPDAPLTRLGARLICLGAMGAFAALPRGGEVTVELGADAVLRVTGAGPGMRLQPNAPAWLAGDPGEEAAEPRDVQWPAAHAAAHAGGAAVALDQSGEALRFTAALPAPG
jgi:histidine phosphotransferase ChpT